MTETAAEARSNESRECWSPTLAGDRTYIHAIVMDAVFVGHSIELLIAFVQSVRRMSLHFFNMQPKVWAVFSGPEFDQPIVQGNQLFRKLSQFFLVATREEIAPQQIRIDVPWGLGTHAFEHLDKL